MTKEEFKARVSELVCIDDPWEDFLESMWKLYLEANNRNKLQEELNEIKKRISKLERDKQILVPFTQTTVFPYDDFPCDGIHCDNPHMDCINCPRKAGYGWNTGQVTTATTDISKIKADENPHWVNAKEIVPEISALGVSDKVICYDGDNMYMACYNHKTQKWETPHQGEILYWMNLPKPPKV